MVVRCALGVADCVAHIDKWGTDGCTLVNAPNSIGVPMCEIDETFRNLELKRIDLMLINIEGYEYTLIPHMLDQGILPDRLMVHFHTFADPGGMQMAAIYEGLARAGYRIAWTYGVVLTAWERAT